MRRRQILVSAVAAAIIVIALVVSGLSHLFTRSYSLEIANRLVVAQLHSHQKRCEGPITVTGGTFTQAQVFGASVLPVSQVEIRVLTDPGGRLLGSGSFRPTQAGAAYTATFAHPISDAQPLRVCVVSRLNTFVLQGNDQFAPPLKMGNGKTGLFSLSLGNEKSALDALSTAFGRAPALKPSWVGAWTFWVLAAALLGCFGLGVFAVARAAGDGSDPE